MNDTITEISSKTTYTGAVTGFVAWFQNVDWLAVVGFALAVAGFAVNFYYQRKRDRREEEKHQAELEVLRNGRQK